MFVAFVFYCLLSYIVIHPTFSAIQLLNSMRLSSSYAIPHDIGLSKTGVNYSLNLAEGREMTICSAVTPVMIRNHTRMEVRLESWVQHPFDLTSFHNDVFEEDHNLKNCKATALQPLVVH